MTKPNPPAKLIKSLLDKSDLSVADAADLLKIGRQHLNNLINGKYSITPEMAIRLELVFNSNARKWLELQLEYDLTLVRKKKFKLKKFSRVRLKAKLDKS